MASQKKEETFIDGSIWEKSKTKGDDYLKKLIEHGLNNTSVTTLLIGEDTVSRRWVNYKIIKSFDRGNGILGIHINRIKGRTGLTARGLNPLDRLGFKVSDDGAKIRFYELKSRTWQIFKDLPEINNKKSNTLYFDNHWFRGNEYGNFFRFSDKFLTYCWINDDGNKNFSNWVNEAAENAER